MFTSKSMAAAVVARMNGGYAQSRVPLVTISDMRLVAIDSLSSCIVPAKSAAPSPVPQANLPGNCMLPRSLVCPGLRHANPDYIG